MEFFQDTEKLVIKQKFEPLEALANAAANALDMDMLGGLGETANKYDVFTDDGGDKFRVIETSEYCGCTGRACCRPNHELKLHVFAPGKSSSEEVMFFERPCKCGQCCACHNICMQEMHVFDGPEAMGNRIGYITQPFLGGGLSPTVHIMEREEDEEPVATVTANAVCCIGGLCCDHTFEVTDAQGNVIGKIIKTKPSDIGQFAQELVSDADVFALEVNKDLDVKRKANIFAALHLIDYMFFENEGEVKLDAANQECSFKCCDLYCFGCVCPCNCSCGGKDEEEEENPDLASG
eukprot:scaffold12769_cov141-Cylindrotheca_fusiformis.AAC.12